MEYNPLIGEDISGIKEAQKYDNQALKNPDLLKKQISLITDNYFRTHSPFKTGRIQCFISTLTKHLNQAKVKGFPEKAVVFTEYLRTLKYVTHSLEEHDPSLKVIEYHGSLSSRKNEAGFSERDKVLEDFKKSNKAILVATEAGAEGLNLQFCNLVINYDLPWNPQRVEQRIGRCHRYGQKNDVIVVNFICSDNNAERHIFEILSQKFNLFEGIFGASNTILGAIQSGVDIEKMLSEIYLGIRDVDSVKKDLDKFLEISEDKRKKGIHQTAKKLFVEFDPEVIKRLKLDWEELKKEVQFNLSTNEKKLSKLLADHFTKCEGPDNYGVMRIQDTRYPKLSFKPHTVQRIRASEDIPFLSVRHPEVSNIVRSANNFIKKQ